MTLDYSNFGPGLNAEVAYMVCKLITKRSKEKIKDIEEVELNALLMEIVNSEHIAFNTVYRQFSGSPSGESCTTIINSLVNLLYVLVAWINLMSEFFHDRLDVWMAFRQHVRLVVYGDDLIMNVSDSIKELFNTVTIGNFFSLYGITATSAEKDAELVPYKPLIYQSFLKRGFIPHPNHRRLWLSPLKWDSINGTTQWIWSCADVMRVVLVR